MINYLAKANSNKTINLGSWLNKVKRKQSKEKHAHASIKLPETDSNRVLFATNPFNSLNLLKSVQSRDN